MLIMSVGPGTVLDSLTRCSCSPSASTTRPHRSRCASGSRSTPTACPQALRDLVDQEPVREAAIISTCNRTEVYCSTQEPATAVRWLAGYHQLKTSAVEPYVYTLPRERAVKHAFRVASGLDSMVLGEPQILGQMKQAVRSAEEAGTLGLVLHKLFQHTFSVAKQVRSRDRDRRELGVDGGGGGAAGRAHLSQHLRAEGAVHRCGRDDRAHAPRTSARSIRAA